MARLEYIRYAPHRVSIKDGHLQWSLVANCKAIDDLPQLFWEDSRPWRAANLWGMERATEGNVNIKTVHSNFTALHAYANWLEVTGTDWQDFPTKKADRCLVRYRGALITARDKGELAPSTASQRMASVVKFYRWLYEKNLLSPDIHLWTPKSAAISITTKFGLERTILVNSTDLAIPNRSTHGEKLEDGLLPVSIRDRDAILMFVKENFSEEFFLILTLGFFTGMRLGTLSDLKIQTLEHAVPDPASPDLFRLAVGPGASPPIHTKFGVTGQVWITKTHLDAVKDYAYSIRRLNREAKATPENKDLIFLTRFGNAYGRHGSDKSSALNVEIHRLRKATILSGIAALRSFHFHQTRCTYATELARLAISVSGAINAIAIVRDALLQRQEATALKYIRFVERTPAKEKMSNAFTQAFLGIVHAKRGSHND